MEYLGLKRKETLEENLFYILTMLNCKMEHTKGDKKNKNYVQGQDPRQFFKNMSNKGA